LSHQLSLLQKGGPHFAISPLHSPPDKKHGGGKEGQQWQYQPHFSHTLKAGVLSVVHGLSFQTTQGVAKLQQTIIHSKIRHVLTFAEARLWRYFADGIIQPQHSPELRQDNRMVWD